MYCHPFSHSQPLSNRLWLSSIGSVGSVDHFSCLRWLRRAVVFGRVRLRRLPDMGKWITGQRDGWSKRIITVHAVYASRTNDAWPRIVPIWCTVMTDPILIYSPTYRNPKYVHHHGSHVWTSSSSGLCWWIKVITLNKFTHFFCG